jgi:hypothetical protein
MADPFELRGHVAPVTPGDGGSGLSMVGALTKGLLHDAAAAYAHGC